MTMVTIHSVLEGPILLDKDYVLVCRVSTEDPEETSIEEVRIEDFTDAYNICKAVLDGPVHLNLDWVNFDD